MTLNDKEEVKAVIKAFPTALSYIKGGRLPIHSAAFGGNTLRFLPLLAQEGEQLEVGGKGKRGGILVEVPDRDSNLLQELACLEIQNAPASSDTACLGILTELRELNLLRKEDIKELDLLLHSATTSGEYLTPPFITKQRFDFFLDWDPQALTYSYYTYGRPCLQMVLNAESFAMALEAGIKHFPEELGFLFQKNTSGQTSCDFAFGLHGKHKMLKLIQKCIPASANYPILHHVLKNNPEYMNDFAVRYPSAVFLRDEHQRSIHHVALSGGMNFEKNSMFLLQMTDDKVEEKDPMTDQYPFQIAASAETSYLSTIYYLLRRNPALLAERDPVGKVKPVHNEKKRKRA